MTLGSRYELIAIAAATVTTQINNPTILNTTEIYPPTLGQKANVLYLPSQQKLESSEITT